jgi:hypothetical protein
MPKWSRLEVKKNFGPVFEWKKQNGGQIMAAILKKTSEYRISKVSEKWPFEYRTVRYSVGYCTELFIRTCILDHGLKFESFVIWKTLDHLKSGLVW